MIEYGEEENKDIPGGLLRVRNIDAGVGCTRMLFVTGQADTGSTWTSCAVTSSSMVVLGIPSRDLAALRALLDLYFAEDGGAVDGTAAKYHPDETDKNFGGGPF